jgi:hypothetical protein
MSAVPDPRKDAVVDGGDLEVPPGNAEKTAGQIATQLEPVVRAGLTPLVLGGDHSVVLGELRAHAAVRGPLAVVLLDAHADTWEAYYGERYFHGTPFKRALEEGLIDPHRTLPAGMRGSLYAASDLDEPRARGFEIVPCEELRTWSPAEYGARVRRLRAARARGDQRQRGSQSQRRGRRRRSARAMIAAMIRNGLRTAPSTSISTMPVSASAVPTQANAHTIPGPPSVRNARMPSGIMAGGMPRRRGGAA